jgi:hypothetical protein
MNQKFPPWALVKTWLDIIQEDEISRPIKQKRIKMLTCFFGSIEFADMYVEQNQHNYKKAF